MEPQNNNIYTLEVSIDLDDVINSICAQSAWHCVHNPKLYRITPDNRRLITLKVKEAYDLLTAKAMGYISFANFNPNIEHANIRLTFSFRHPFDEALPTQLKQILENAFAAYALMRCYSGIDDYHATAWRKYSAQLMLAFLRDANHDILTRA
jgi:hypothetical protein